MLIGEYKHTIDDKGRVILPSRFKKEFGKEFYLSRGLDGVIIVYTQKAWKELNQKLSKLSITKKSERQFKRFMLSGAEKVELDKQGRVRIPLFLKEHASLKKKLVWIGVGDKAEIWSEENWDIYIKEQLNNPEEIADSLEGII